MAAYALHGQRTSKALRDKILRFAKAVIFGWPPFLVFCSMGSPALTISLTTGFTPGNQQTRLFGNLGSRLFLDVFEIFSSPHGVGTDSVDSQHLALLQNLAL